MVAQRALVEDDLRTGRLVAPLRAARPNQRRLLPGVPSRPAKPARVQAFEDWIAQEAAAVESRFPASEPVLAQLSLS